MVITLNLNIFKKCLFVLMVMAVGQLHAIKEDILSSRSLLYQHESEDFQKMRTLERIVELRKKRKQEREDSKIPLTPAEKAKEEKEDLEINQQISDCMSNLVHKIGMQDRIESKLGGVIAQGLAGKDCKMNQTVEGIYEGLQIGALMRVSQSVGDVVGKRLENTMDRVLGGTWDFLIGKLLDGWDTMVQFFFHASQEPFTVKEIRGWVGLIMNCFEDVERLLKDGLKDSLRGTDSSLRAIGDVVEQEAAQTAWTVLISGYIRQLDYFVQQIDSRIEYYDEKSIAVFYAKEIKNRLMEFQSMLFKNQSLKDLDAYLDSNKAMIPALRKNIDNLFRRLLEQVEPRSYSAAGQDTSANVRESRSRRDSDEESSFPRSLGGL